MSNGRERLLSVFDQLLSEFQDLLKTYKVPDDAIDWVKKSFQYNVPNGKLNRGLSVIDSYCILKNKKADDLSEKEFYKISVLAWCVELLQASYLVADDIMDKSELRRGKECWYLKKDVGSISINDSFMLKSSIFFFLKKTFGKDSCYLKILELFNEITLQTEIGQLIDLITSNEENYGIKKFSLERHCIIVIFKTAYYSFYLPVALSMIVIGINNEFCVKQVQSILITLGTYFQIQDDYLDCFGAHEEIGKIGTDIKDNKCSWVINQALILSNPNQLQILKENYGVRNDESEMKCKKIFYELKIQDVYLEYQNSVVSKIQSDIDKIDESTGFKKKILLNFLEKIHNRLN